MACLTHLICTVISFRSTDNSVSFCVSREFDRFSRGCHLSLNRFLKVCLNKNVVFVCMFLKHPVFSEEPRGFISRSFKTYFVKLESLSSEGY